MLLETLKWAGIALITSVVYTNSKPQPTLGSLEEAPADFYTQDFYPGGCYLNLPLGKMRYWKFGNENGTRVVLVHGITTGSVVYSKLAFDLAASGHHVLIYDLWGRGYSQAPAVTYDEALYTSQLAMLLQKVGWDKTGVVGVSLGGAIATSFASFYPEMVNKLVLISPAGLINSETDMPLISKVVKLPYVHQFITNQPYVRPLLVKVAENFARSTQLEQTGLDDETEAASNYIAKVATYQFLHHAGLLRAFIGTVVAFPLTDLEDKYKKVGQTDIPTLVIWGDKDKTCPYYPEKIKKLLPKTKLAIFQDQGHDVLITRFRQIHKEIESFLVS